MISIVCYFLFLAVLVAVLKKNQKIWNCENYFQHKCVAGQKNKFEDFQLQHHTWPWDHNFQFYLVFKRVVIFSLVGKFKSILINEEANWSGDIIKFIPPGLYPKWSKVDKGRFLLTPDTTCLRKVRNWFAFFRQKKLSFLHGELENAADTPLFVFNLARRDPR